MNFGQALGESINRAACVVLGDFAARVETLRYVLEPLDSGGGAYNGAAAVYAQRCGLPLPNDFTPGPQFTGGQCRFRYVIQANYTATHPTLAPLTGSISGTGWGPISNVRAVQNGGNYDFQATGAQSGTNATPVTISLGGIGGGAANGYRLPTLSNIRVTREGGGPDTCGNPPFVTPVYEPGDNTTNTSVTYTNNNNVSVTIPVAIAFGYARVDLNGTIEIPFTANFSANPELNFTGNFNLNTGGYSTNGGNQPGGVSDCVKNPNKNTPDTPIAPPPVDDPDPGLPNDPSDDDPSQEKVIVGCFVRTLVVPSTVTRIFQESNPDVFAPDLGLVSFRIRSGKYAGWTEDIRVKNLNSYIPAPQGVRAIDVRGTPRTGGQWILTADVQERTKQPAYPL